MTFHRVKWLQTRAGQKDPSADNIIPEPRWNRVKRSSQTVHYTANLMKFHIDMLILHKVFIEHTCQILFVGIIFL